MKRRGRRRRCTPRAPWAVRGISQCWTWRSSGRTTIGMSPCVCPSEVQTNWMGKTGSEQPGQQRCTRSDIARTIIGGARDAPDARRLWPEHQRSSPTTRGKKTKPRWTSQKLNLLAVGVATVLSFGLGAVWYFAATKAGTRGWRLTVYAGGKWTVPRHQPVLRGPKVQLHDRVHVACVPDGARAGDGAGRTSAMGKSWRCCTIRTSCYWRRIHRRAVGVTNSRFSEKPIRALGDRRGLPARLDLCE